MADSYPFVVSLTSWTKLSHCHNWLHKLSLHPRVLNELTAEVVEPSSIEVCQLKFAVLEGYEQIRKLQMWYPCSGREGDDKWVTVGLSQY